MTWRRGGLLLVILLLFVVVGSIGVLVDDGDRDNDGSVGIEEDVPVRPHGGVVRVAVPTPPEMPDESDGGATLRQLVLPSLFVAQPDGTWRASLVQPGTDRLSDDSMSARFRLRAGAKWSDGSSITVDDLRRTRDERFVSTVEAIGELGDVTVRFTQALPGWRRLWSGDDAIRPLNPDAYGGPYRVQSVVSGLETVLVRNESWWGAARSAFLDEIRLILVPDVIVARELLIGGSIDVIAPPADTVRSARLRNLDGIAFSRSDDTNAWVMLRINGERVPLEQRRVIVSVFPRDDFVDALLDGEATLLEGLTDEEVWPADSARDLVGQTDTNAAISGATGSDTNVEFVLSSQQPIVPLLGRALERAADKVGIEGRSRLADDAELDRLLKDNNYDVALEVVNDGPDLCWRCHFPAHLDLARRSDEGDAEARIALQQALRDEVLVIPLWKPAAVVGSRSGVVDGVQANGYARGVAWNADRWWRPG